LNLQAGRCENVKYRNGEFDGFRYGVSKVRRMEIENKEKKARTKKQQNKQ
jgi:hypothetical protein